MYPRRRIGDRVRPFKLANPIKWVGREWTNGGDNLRLTGRRSYSNAGDKPWQTAALSGTQRDQSRISERGAAIC